jgi:DNA-binding beta-propeller fold protein YncE
MLADFWTGTGVGCERGARVTVEGLEPRTFLSVVAPGTTYPVGTLVPWLTPPITAAAAVPSPTPVGGTSPTPTPSADPAARYLYAFDAPKNRQGFESQVPQIEVFDIADGHKWVKNIPIPARIYDIRGVAASPATGRLYISYFLTPRIGYQPGGLLCMDLNTNALIWKRDYDQADVPAPDRFALTPDGAKIYMPSGEFGTSDFWVVIDAATGDPLGRIHATSTAHNTIVSADGSRAFLEGQEKQPEPEAIRHTVAVVDTATDQVIQHVGPFRDVVRPFTVNGRGTLVFATVNNFRGFQVADVATGRVLYTAAPTGVAQPTGTSIVSHNHGIALTPDEKQLYVVDTDRAGVYAWDVSGVGQGEPPRYLGYTQLRRAGRDLAGNPDPAASSDTNGAPSWLAVSYDGRYLYAEGGEIIDTSTNEVIGQLRAKTAAPDGTLRWAPYTHSRYLLEVDFDGGRAVRVTDQFAIGRVV